MSFLERLWMDGPQMAQPADLLEVKALWDAGDIQRVSMADGSTQWKLTNQGWSKIMAENSKEEQHDNALLNERGNNYGSFGEHARITQSLKKVMTQTPNWSGLSFSQLEALEMVAHKIGRILNGNPEYIDSWKDIVGYTQLVVDELMVTEGATDAKVVKQVVRKGKLVDA